MSRIWCAECKNNDCVFTYTYTHADARKVSKKCSTTTALMQQNSSKLLHAPKQTQTERASSAEDSYVWTQTGAANTNTNLVTHMDTTERNMDW